MNAELRSLLPPPSGGPLLPRQHWVEAETTLGVQFPDGYKEVIDAYGWGSIGGELGLFDPRQIDRYWTTVEGTLTALREDHDEDGEYPLPGFPAPGRRSLLAIAGNGNGDDVYLTVDDNVADDARIWIGNYRNIEFIQVPGPFADLLTAVLRRTGPYEQIVETFGDYAWALERRFYPNPVA